jgi:hypothetical protein
MNRKGFAPLVVIGIIAVIIVVGAIGYFAWKGSISKQISYPKSTSTTIATTTNSAETSTGSTSTTPVSSSQWNIYSNTTYGYSLKYPASWSIAYQSTSSDDLIFRDANNPYATYFEIHYEANANSSKELISRWANDLSQNFPNPLPVPLVTTTVGGYPAAQVEGVDIGTTMITYVSRGSDILEIDYELYDPNGATSTFIGDYQTMINSISFLH